MRLDEFLVYSGYFSSRTKAQRAIKAGQIIVDGVVVKKSGFRVTSDNQITVLSNIFEKPYGYLKLERIVSEIGNQPIKSGIKLLDIGSSAGGFVLYALEKGASLVVGIEISNKFKSHLLKIKDAYKDRVNFIFGDAKAVKSKIQQRFGSFEVITCDITAEPTFTLSIVCEYSDLLETNGYFIFSLKLPKQYQSENQAKNELISMAEKILNKCNLVMIKVIPPGEKQEFFVLAVKK